MINSCSSNLILSAMLCLILSSCLPFINKENVKNDTVLPFLTPSSPGHQQNVEPDVFTVPGKYSMHLELHKVGKTSMDLDIKHKLKISFDSLNREEKQIFMDISCFFIDREKSMAIRIWKGSGWNGEHALQSLKDKSLVEDLDPLRMVDQVRDFEREMADELSPPSRLWRPHELESLELKGFRNILAETSGNSFRSCLYFNLKDSSTKSPIYIMSFLGNSDDFAETSTVLLWLELDVYNSELTSIPSWIPLQNLQVLIISSGHFERLWDREVQAPFQLKELVLDEVSLQEFPSSLGKFKDLERLELFFSSSYRVGDLLIGYPDEMLLEGRPVLESIRKLSNLRSLVLRNSKASGEVTLNSNGQSNTHEPPMSSLKTIQINGLKLTSKFSVSGKYCTSLESLHLENMDGLIEVDLAMLTTLKSIQLINCPKLKPVSGISDFTKLETLNIQSCPELEEFPNLAHLKFLESITIDGSPKLLQNAQVIEELEGLKRLRLFRSRQWSHMELHT